MSAWLWAFFCLIAVIALGIGKHRPQKPPPAQTILPDRIEVYLTDYEVCNTLEEWQDSLEPLWKGEIDIEFEYLSGAACTSRTVTLYSIVEADNEFVYLCGLCHLRGEERHFRTDRVKGSVFVPSLDRHVKPDDLLQLLTTGDVSERDETMPSRYSDTSPDETLYAVVVRFCQAEQRVSISAIQRQFRVGFNKAARMVEQMEQDGIIRPGDRENKSRQIV